MIGTRNILVENIEYSTIHVHIEQAKPLNNHPPSPAQSSKIVARPASKPITDHLAYLLAQANREINRQLDARFRKEGVPVEQWRILKVLSDHKGHSMGELAEAVLLNHPTLTKMVDRMVSDSLVYRVQDDEDRRKVLMLISERGKALTQRLNSLAMSQEAHIAESYGNKATTELKRLLESLIEKSN
jgi:MarR family transcriptional regulator, organic hydroperoxide resistance regulator